MKKNKFKTILSLLFTIGLISSCQSKESEIQPLKLWYKQPANAQIPDNKNAWKDDPEWLKALPLGNGSLGLMVFGDVNNERIQLNEESMWSGSPADNNNPIAYPALKKIRRLLFENKYKEASELTAKTQISKGKGSGHGNGANVPFGSFQTLGDLWINFEKQHSYENYYRELDLNDAIVRVSYLQDGINFKREIFTSYPDQVMVAKFTADKPGNISFTCKMDRPERYSTKSEGNQLVLFGSLDDGNGNKGLNYITRLSAVNKNGIVSYTDSTLVVKNADEVLLLLSASTDYILEYPHYKGRDHKNITNKNLLKAEKKSYNDLLNDHIIDYQKYYNRLSIDLSGGIDDNIPTDVRVEKFKESKNDLKLVELFFQYGRYLLISSSRPGTLPANLQGIWSNKIQSPWNGDYHTDVNVEMNYWHAEVTNLSEMHMPLVDLIESLVEPGSKTAKIHYNARGWVVHPITNVWGYTAPGESSSWGMHVSAGAWILSHLGEHYYFTYDQEFLKRIYPVMKSSVSFYLDWLIVNPKTGKLVSGPAVSPENSFIAPDGNNCQISMGPAHDHQVIWNLFNDFIFASNELGIKDDFVENVIDAQNNLEGPKIGSDGRLMEWSEEFKETEPGHRHISHMFAVHPGSQINLKNTPKLAEAAKKSLDYRIQNGSGHTGWSAAWLINQYARHGDGEKAKNSLDVVLSKSTSPNLFGQHPPFQMDANFGTTSGIAEMLISSHAGEIVLLPALPDEWPNGAISGLCAKGGFEIDMRWKSGELVYARIFSKLGKKCIVKYKSHEKVFETTIGGEYFPFTT